MKKKTLTITLIILAIATACFFLRGLIPFRYAATVESGKETIPWVRDFDRVYPKAEHSISYFTGTAGRPTWNSAVGLYGRYILTLQIPITLNGLHNRVVSYGQPTFILQEVTSVAGGAGGTTDIRYNPDFEPQSLSPADWNKIVQAGGDLKAVVSSIKTDQSISKFDSAWKQP